MCYLSSENMNMCFKGLAKTALAAGYGALGKSVNAERCKEIYNQLQAPGIKNNANQGLHV